MAKNKRVVRYKSKFNLNIGIIVFGLILIYLFINIVIYFTTERTTYYEVISGSSAEVDNKIFTGIALRDEKIKYADSDGYIDYFVREGSRISKNTTLYSIDETGKLSEILTKVSKKNSKLTEDNISTISDLLYDYTNSRDDSEFGKVYDFKTSLKGTVVDLINMNSLKKAASEAGDSFTIAKSALTGIVLYRVDDFETKKPKDLKSSDFNKNTYTSAKFSSGEKVTKGDPLYKAVTDEEWDIAIQLSKSDAKKYKDTKGVSIKFAKDNQTSTANFKIVKGADNKKYGIVTLSKYAIRYVNDRFIDIQILDNVKQGLKIPKSSLVTKDLYVIPKEYGAKGGNGDSIGFKRKIQSEGKETEEFYYPTIAYSDDSNYYVSTAMFNSGDVLSPLESSETYTIGRKQQFVGVYNINNGYTVFTNVDILSSTDEYYIVESGETYGLAMYDRIVLDGSKVKENQIIFQ